MLNKQSLCLNLTFKCPNVTSRSLVTVTRLLLLLVPAANLPPEAADGLLPDAVPRESTRRSYIPRVALFPLGLTGIPRV